ncbi:MAG: ABC transporter permease [Candidatus Peribacteraceae bacterium]|jgi:putative ABC transport system permease protein
MRLSDFSGTCWQALRTNRQRSFFSSLGIAVGISAVILLTSLGRSAQGMILDIMGNIRADQMAIFPGRGKLELGPRKYTDSLKYGDEAALAKLPAVEAVYPFVLLRNEVLYRGRSVHHEVRGVNGVYLPENDVQIRRGRGITQEDVERRRSVAVLGPETARQLFHTEDPLGKKVKIEGQAFTVVGIAEAKGTEAMVVILNADKRVYVPLSSAQALRGEKQYFDAIFLTVSGDAAAVKRETEQILRRQHGIKNPEGDIEKDDFFVATGEEVQQIVANVSRTLTMFLIALAALSLFIGGIGVMNIVYLSVEERTFEIGLRQALGAKQGDILRQILGESVLLCLFGGAMGVVLGVGLAAGSSFFIGLYLDGWAFAFSWMPLLFALLVAMGSGVFFGYLPARSAAQLEPSDALR